MNGYENDVSYVSSMEELIDNIEFHGKYLPSLPEYSSYTEA